MTSGNITNPIRKVAEVYQMTKALEKKQQKNLGETYIMQWIENG